MATAAQCQQFVVTKTDEHVGVEERLKAGIDRAPRGFFSLKA